jgi:hypothetical protein
LEHGVNGKPSHLDQLTNASYHSAAFLGALQDAKDRAFAAASLAVHVAASETEVDKPMGSGGRDGIDYAVKRLVRGLCSSRGGARQGFATGLTLALAATTDSQVTHCAHITIQPLFFLSHRPHNLRLSKKS